MKFLKLLFAAEPGASFSRVATFIALVFSCTWVTHLVWHNHQLPDFSGLTLFVGSLYGLGKASDLVARLKNGDTPTPPPTQP